MSVPSTDNLERIGPGLGRRSRIWSVVRKRVIAKTKTGDKVHIGERRKLDLLAEGTTWLSTVPEEFRTLYGTLYDERGCRNALSSKTSDQIMRDVPRTFSLYIEHQRYLRLEFPENMGLYCAALQQVLEAACHQDFGCGYCQGMNFLAATFLLSEASKRNAYIIFSYVVKQCNLEILYNPKCSSLLEYMQYFEQRLASHNKAVYDHLMREEFPPLCYTVEWFTTCYLVSSPGELSACVIDLLLLGFNDIMIRVGLALMDHLEPVILRSNAEKLQLNFKKMLLLANCVEVMSRALMIPNDDMDGVSRLETMKINTDTMDPNAEWVDTMKSPAYRIHTVLSTSSSQTFGSSANLQRSVAAGAGTGTGTPTSGMGTPPPTTISPLSDNPEGHILPSFSPKGGSVTDLLSPQNNTETLTQPRTHAPNTSSQSHLYVETVVQSSTLQPVGSGALKVDYEEYSMTGYGYSEAPTPRVITPTTESTASSSACIHPVVINSNSNNQINNPSKATMSCGYEASTPRVHSTASSVTSASVSSYTPKKNKPQSAEWDGYSAPTPRVRSPSEPPTPDSVLVSESSNGHHCITEHGSLDKHLFDDYAILSGKSHESALHMQETSPKRGSERRRTKSKESKDNRSNEKTQTTAAGSANPSITRATSSAAHTGNMNGSSSSSSTRNTRNSRNKSNDIHISTPSSEAEGTNTDTAAAASPASRSMARSFRMMFTSSSRRNHKNSNSSSSGGAVVAESGSPKVSSKSPRQKEKKKAEMPDAAKRELLTLFDI